MNNVFLGQELGLEWWNILNYYWGFFRDKLEIFYYCIISNNISDKFLATIFILIYYKWTSYIIPNNILDIDLVYVFYPYIKSE